MKKFLSVLVAVALCLCMVAPAAFAANTSSILDGIDLGGLSKDEAQKILKDLGLNSDDYDKLLGLDTKGDSGSGSGSGSGSSSSGSSDILGSIVGSLSGLLGGSDSGSGFDASAITDMLGSVDLSSLTDVISGAFSGSGFDIGSLTEGFDLGSFDFSSILGGLGGGSSDGSGSGSSSSGIMDTMSGIMDTLTSGLASLGIDTSVIEGLLDNDLVNFFANLYIGLGEVVKPETTTAPTTTKPAAATTKTPKTGDTSAVFVALGVIAVASAAAFVCLKKKKD